MIKIKQCIENYINQYTRDIMLDKFIEFGNAKTEYVIIAEYYGISISILNDLTLDSFILNFKNDESYLMHTEAYNDHKDLLLYIKSVLDIVQIKCFIDRYENLYTNTVKLEDFDFSKPQFIISTKNKKLIGTVSQNLDFSYELLAIKEEKLLEKATIASEDLNVLIINLEKVLTKMLM